MIESISMLRKGKKGVKYEWGHWDLAESLIFAPIPEVMTC